MFQLKWILNGLKDVFYWISGAGILFIVYRFLLQILKARALKKSDEHSTRDIQKFETEVKKLEKSWSDNGKEVDKAKNSS